MNQLASVFITAAAPQKIVFVLLAGSIAAALLVALRDVRARLPAARARGFISELRIAGPALGLLTASLNGLHMAQTMLRLPRVTAQMLAPGVMEVAALAGLGALAGLVAVTLHAALRPQP
jgi:hypothetical protein